MAVSLFSLARGISRLANAATSLGNTPMTRRGLFRTVAALAVGGTLISSCRRTEKTIQEKDFLQLNQKLLDNYGFSIIALSNIRTDSFALGSLISGTTVLLKIKVTNEAIESIEFIKPAGVKQSPYHDTATGNRLSPPDGKSDYRGDVYYFDQDWIGGSAALAGKRTLHFLIKYRDGEEILLDASFINKNHRDPSAIPDNF